MASASAWCSAWVGPRSVEARPSRRQPSAMSMSRAGPSPGSHHPSFPKHPRLPYCALGAPSPYSISIGSDRGNHLRSGEEAWKTLRSTEIRDPSAHRGDRPGPTRSSQSARGRGRRGGQLRARRTRSPPARATRRLPRGSLSSSRCPSSSSQRAASSGRPRACQASRARCRSASAPGDGPTIPAASIAAASPTG